MSELKMKFQENPRYLYYGILLAYLLSLLTIFTLRVTAGSGEVNVATNQIGQYVGVGQNDLTVSDLIYNPETSIVEVDVNIKKEQSAIEDLPDYEFAGFGFYRYRYVFAARNNSSFRKLLRDLLWGCAKRLSGTLAYGSGSEGRGPPAQI